MSNQLQITGGAKVRNLEGVITGSTGVLGSVPYGGPNGVATLDSGGKVPVSQLPASVVTYLGTWNAATNTPTLTNGVGDAGDLYICNVAGTANFGAGPVTFAVGDWVLYGSGTWQKSSGQNGTVTSVAASINGNAIGLTGSPITTAGTLAFAFSGTSGQYVNGAGNLTTFPTIINSIGLSMPSAFSVSNSPLTANGTIAVTGAGTAAQYIRGDGTLAAYNPGTGGGGSSQVFYFNGGVASTLTGYEQMSTTAVVGTNADFSISSDGYIASFLTDVGSPNQLSIPAGNWNFEMYFDASSAGGFPTFYVELYKYNGSLTLIASSASSPEFISNGTFIDLYTTALAVPATTLLATDRLAVRVYVVTSGRTITLHTQDSHLCEVITTFSTGITALNGLTKQVQYFAVGTSGSDFNILSATDTHTFNLPTASATKRGALSSADWSTFNGKQNAITLTTTGTSGAATFIGNTLNIPNYAPDLSGYVPYTGATTNVNLEAYQLTATNLIANGSTGTSGMLHLKNDASQVPKGNGYTSIGASSTSILVQTYTGVSTYKSYLLNASILTDGVNRIYTLPDASGTIALVGGSGVGTVTSVALSAPTGFSVSGSPVTSSGTLALAFASGYSLPTTASQTNWDTAYTNRITSLTTTGSSGAATLTSNVLNIPNYGLALSGYLPLTGGTLTGALVGTTATFNSGASSQTLTLQSTGAASQIWLSDSGTTAGYVRISSNANSLIFYANLTQQLSLFSSGASAFSGSVTATSFIKTSGTSIQYLMADGSVSTLSNPVTGTGTTNYVPKFTGTGTIGNSNLQEVSGNLGLGIIPSSWGGGFNALQVNIAAFRASGFTTGLSHNWYYDGTSFLYINSGVAASDYYQNSGQHVWRNAPSGTAGSSISFTQAMTLTAAGRLLLGTSTESTYLLDVNGTGRFSSSVNGQNFISPSTRSNTIDIGNVTNYPNYNFVGYGGYWGLRTDLSNGFNLDTYNGGTPKNIINITQAGAATFSSSVTATNLTVNGGSTAAFVSIIESNSSFSFGSTNERRVAYITYNTGDKPGLQFGYDATDNTGIIAGATNTAGAGIDFYTFDGSNWGNRVRIKKNGIVNIANVPTSTSGLVTGDIYKTVAGVLMIVL